MMVPDFRTFARAAPTASVSDGELVMYSINIHLFLIHFIRWRRKSKVPSSGRPRGERFGPSVAIAAANRYNMDI
jgi:hypothetical protein